jgi:hypothetical protein
MHAEKSFFMAYNHVYQLVGVGVHAETDFFNQNESNQQEEPLLVS